MAEPKSIDDAMSAAERRERQNGSAAGQRTLEYVTFADAEPLLGGRKLVKGWLEQEQLSLMFGPPGCRKTFLMLDLGLHVAQGIEWHGCKVARGGVVYVAAEAGRSIANRICAFKYHYKLQHVKLPFAVVTSPVDLCHITSPKTNKLKETSDLTLLRDVIKDAGARMKVPVQLVIIDTVARSLAGGNENSPDDMGSFVRALDLLRDKFKCHVAAVHRIGKDRERQARGHSSFLCAVDTAIEVQAKDEFSTATIVKQRDGLSNFSKSFRLRPVDLGRDEDQEPVYSCIVEWVERPVEEPKGQPKEALDVLIKLSDGGKVEVEIEKWRRACKDAGMGGPNPESAQKAFRRAIEALTEAGGPVGLNGKVVWIKSKGELDLDEEPF